jgi:hypothetical protein
MGIWSSKAKDDGAQPSQPEAESSQPAAESSRPAAVSSRLAAESSRPASFAPSGRDYNWTHSVPAARQPAPSQPVVLQRRPVPAQPVPPQPAAPRPVRDVFMCPKCNNKWYVPQSSPLWSAPCRKCRATGYRIGIGTYKCDCGNTFTSKGRLDVQARCYKCKRMVTTYSLRSADRDIHAQTNNVHSCSLCEGTNFCPLMHQRRELESSG